jgi:uncharacterized paraquat-inducible protein A
MQNLSTQRCFNHATREAVARCPECGRFFCRECVTDHDDRAICGGCVRKLARVPLLRRPAFARIREALQCLCSLTLAWFFFYLLGSGLLQLPDSFHEATLWKVHWLDQE